MAKYFPVWHSDTVNKLNIIHKSGLDVMSHMNNNKKFLLHSSCWAHLNLLLFLIDVRPILKSTVHQCMHRYTERIKISLIVRLIRNPTNVTPEKFRNVQIDEFNCA